MYLSPPSLFSRHAVPGKKHNALDIPVAPQTDSPFELDNRIAADDNDRVVVPGQPRS